MKLRHFSRISWLMLAVGAVMAQASGPGRAISATEAVERVRRQMATA
jgi:hypothetical protein